jgi:hypothetical protein
LDLILRRNLEAPDNHAPHRSRFPREAGDNLRARHRYSVGTDDPYPWATSALDHILGTPGLSDAERVAMLGGTATKLLGITA